MPRDDAPAPYVLSAVIAGRDLSLRPGRQSQTRVAIHTAGLSFGAEVTAWMPGSSPGMTKAGADGSAVILIYDASEPDGSHSDVCVPSSH
ncbi:MAG: hypothetical protein AAF354_03910 [Pseudomonadota bacterium]